MRTAAELRAEADHLRTHPLNTLSFHTTTDRATNRWRLPKPTGDYATDHATGCKLAAELIAAAQQTEALGQVNNAGMLILLVLERVKGHDMRMGFMEVIAMAMVSGMPAEDLLSMMEARWNRVFARNDTLFLVH